MTRIVCITGMGLVNPSGIGKEQFWKNVSHGKNNIGLITRFPCENFPIQVAGQLNNFKASDYVPRRFSVKTDTFTHYAWAAAQLALEDSRLDLTRIDPYKAGVWLGNNAGGWDICERGMYELYRDGAAFVNPWQATAWFLSSPQGYVSIANGIKGMSKSFVCDRASGASAMYFAMRAIQQGHNDIIIAGGTEAPITSFALTCYYETGELAVAKDDPTAYRPFDRRHQGSILGEGATMLILEEKQHALQRGATIYGELSAGAITMDFKKGHQHFSRAQRIAIKKAGLKPKDIDVVFAEGAGTSDCDKAEAEAISETFGNSNIPVTSPKSGFGHLYGASTPTDIVCGLLAVQEQLIPPTPNFESNMSLPLNVIDKPTNKKIKNFLVNSRSREGCNVSLVVKTA